MPFTPTHIVAVLPFWPLRRVVPFSAFAVGAMIPDLPLFFPVVNYAQAHSPMGLMTTCLPLGLGGFFLFELVLRRPMIALLPVGLASRLSPQATVPRRASQLRYVIVLALAIVVGAATHQIWDAFTHKGQWGTYLIPMLNSTIEMGGFSVPGYSAFQHCSTLVGLPLLGVLAAIALSRKVPRSRQATLPVQWKHLALALIFIVPLCVTVHACMSSPNVHQALFLAITRSGAMGMAILVAYGALFHVLAD